MIHKKTFTSALLNAEYELEYTHNLNTEDISNPSWKDENGIYRSTADLFQIIDANTVILRCNGEIEGTQTLYFDYNEAGVSTAGRRLFELNATTNPAETLRIALGKSATPASNITLTAFLAWLMTKLGFLKVASNLSDLNNASSARSNLGVYSANEVDAALGTKATLYQNASGGVLGTNNTAIYNPVSNYNPATLRNVKNSGMRMLLAGSVSAAGVWGATTFLNTDVLDLADVSSSKEGTGHYRITHNIGNTNYRVLATALGTHNAAIVCIDKQATYFDLRIHDSDSFDDQDFEFYMFDFFAYTQDE